MSNWLVLTLAFFLFSDADVPRVNSFRPPANPAPSFTPDEEIPLFPNPGPLNDSQTGSQSPAKAASGPRSATLQETSRLELIRYVSGEFAKALKPMPAGKEGILIYVGKPLSPEAMERAVSTHGAAINPGDNVQITKLDFRSHQIVVDLNGGGRGRKSWRDHLQVSMGGIPNVQTASENTGPPGLQPGMGSTIFLEFNKPLPDLTPEELKQLLSPFLNFAREHSAAVQWFDTLPPEMKKAIQDRKPAVGMDREEVVAAMGKPDHKVRERDTEGNDIEDWIYGQPPSRTVFVRFTGDHVTGIKQFPQ